MKYQRFYEYFEKQKSRIFRKKLTNLYRLCNPILDKMTSTFLDYRVKFLIGFVGYYVPDQYPAQFCLEITKIFLL